MVYWGFFLRIFAVCYNITELDKPENSCPRSYPQSTKDECWWVNLPNSSILSGTTGVHFSLPLLSSGGHLLINSPFIGSPASTSTSPIFYVFPEIIYKTNSLCLKLYLSVFYFLSLLKRKHKNKVNAHFKSFTLKKKLNCFPERWNLPALLLHDLFFHFFKNWIKDLPKLLNPLW